MTEATETKERTAMTAQELKDTIIAELVTEDSRKTHEAKMAEKLAEFTATGYPATAVERINKLRYEVHYWGIGRVWLDTRLQSLDVNRDASTLAVDMSAFDSWPFERLNRWRLAEALEQAEGRATAAEAEVEALKNPKPEEEEE